MDKLLDRFFHYISFDTRAKYNQTTLPSCDGQKQLATVLKDELLALGLTDALLTESGCVLATLPSNVSYDVPVTAFIAHLDTSPDLPGSCTQSQFIFDYQGKEILLSGVGNELISPKMYPDLNRLRDHHLIASDGKSALGASGKASIAEIMTALMLVQKNQIPHGDVKVLFLPDQTLFPHFKSYNLPDSHIDRAYAFECCGQGILSLENLNITRAVIKIQGRHAGHHSTYDDMLNALNMAVGIHAQLETKQSTTSTNYFEGFFHLTNMNGNVEYAEIEYLICNFCDEDILRQKADLTAVVDKLQADLLPGCYIALKMKEVARNRYAQLMEQTQFIEITEQAMRATQQEPCRISNRNPAVLSAQFAELGIPCIALSNGGYNFNSRHEFLSVNQMEDSVELIQKIIQFTAEAVSEVTENSPK